MQGIRSTVKMNGEAIEESSKVISILLVNPKVFLSLFKYIHNMRFQGPTGDS